MQGETLDAYVFVPSGSEDTMDKLKELWKAGHVRYANRVLSGAYGAVAFIEVAVRAEGDVATLGDLKAKLTAVRNQVNPGTSVGVAIQVGTRAPSRWSEKAPVGAYTRIRTERGKARQVFEALNDRFAGRDQYGSALVAGDFDVLIEVDADTIDELGPMIERINGVGGIVSTDSAIVINDPYEPRDPGDQ
ncbi:MAG TPA: hypothetical protein VFW02_00390 [Candidatus Limnocylindrales bacterium]|nr:hypothetical protein [Candidatus Limnocylindrales bacterium]